MTFPEHRYSDSGLADYIANARYARYLPGLRRRETFAETIRRAEAMHREFFRDKLEVKISGFVSPTAADPADYALLYAELRDHSVGEAITDAFAAVRAKQVLPSMRSLQFGGLPILRNQARMFNCAFSLADRLEFFREYFFLLLSGVGCGFSVQWHHVERLPAIARRAASSPAPREHAIAHTPEGWALALDALLRSHVQGRPLRFRYPDPCVPASDDLPRSPESLRLALQEIEAILSGAAGRKLRPIEVYDLCMLVSRAVLDGANRRAASICLFSADDVEMREAKAGDWQRCNPQRAASANSAVLSPSRGDEATFRALLATQREFGEPGLFFTDGPDYGCNPCGEAGLHPVLAGALDPGIIRRLRGYGYAGELDGQVRLSGWEMCNLSTINGAAANGPDDFFRACVHASVLGTLQAAYTAIPFLGPVTRVINECDALLGVSVCGFMDNPQVLFSPRTLERGARLCRATNQLVAAALGINSAARVTCVKPEGTASLLLRTSPGIHPRPAHRYFRRIRVDRDEPVLREFGARHPQLIERPLTAPFTDGVLAFPVEAPAHAITREEIGAHAFLRRVLEVQRNWVLPGEAACSRSPDLHHSVSHTCAVRATEWPDVAAFVWEHRGDFTGVTFFGDEAAARYSQRPLQPVESSEESERWRGLQRRSTDLGGTSREMEREPAPPAACLVGACGD